MNFPQFEIKITSSALKISSPRLHSPIILEYEHKKKSVKLYVDFLLIKEGLSIYCNRLRGTRFLQFTSTNPFPDKCFFRLTNGIHDYSIPLNPDNPSRYFLKLKMDLKGNFQTIEHGKIMETKEKKKDNRKNQKFYNSIKVALAFLDLMVDDKQATNNFKENFKKEGGPEFEEFLNLLSMGTSFVTKEQKELFEKNQQTIQMHESGNESVKDLLYMISSAATFLQFAIPPKNTFESNEVIMKIEPEDI